ncbi:hypothetical protein SCHPADRAFT_926107 [Schizopora paradoxa]|uniref:Rad21/Rec8-like protein N-terminal domain-containing protein n=1 Tax=Schizopora paradoxa TaxID=27342 RepID=A0A0H2RY54_9AGAM|nr:hypothetical protein SCHPADRAFT_926107 [Schizopora paradoxa]
MFFSAELLSKRDSGFGLLWLAATLGSKSSFKKLPKQSIRTADIPQLCDQISRPPEPLALRLSSNLMVGVARVYKIKHEFFVADVNSCFALVRKTIQEIHTLGALSDAQLTMAHPTVRPDAVTLIADPTIAVALEFDTFDASWDDIAELTTQRRRTADDEDDDEFDPQNGRSKRKGKAKASVATVEAGRGLGLHTLDEHHDHLLSTSFDANASFGGIDASSSQIDPGMNFGSFTMDDNIFNGGDGMDMGFDLGIGEDLARELGEGWGATEGGASGANDALVGSDDNMNFDAGLDTMMDFEMEMPLIELNENAPEYSESMKSKSPGSARKRMMSDSDKENRPPLEDVARDPSLSHGNNVYMGANPLDVINLPENLEPVIPEQQGVAPQVPAPHQVTRKPKRVRILIDETTELTDDELRAAREKYLERQLAIREAAERKRAEKESSKAFEDMLWGAPQGLDLPALSDFWTSRYRVQVEARSGAVDLKEKEPSPKRRKLMHNATDRDQDFYQLGNDDNALQFGNDDMAAFGGDYDFNNFNQDMDMPMDMDDPVRLRSSEEPERGRNASRAPSVLNFDPEALNPSSGTQRSAFFPWDNAAGTSSTNGGAYMPLGSGSDRISIDKADTQIKLPRSSLSISAGVGGGGSFMMPPSQTGSASGLNFGVSPDRMGHRGSDDFQFDVTNDIPNGTAQDTQDTEMTLVTLEKTSYNFLEYCKIQLQSLPGMHTSLSFDDVVPRETSTKRVAAAALYHCLVLSTKDLVSVKQEQPYEPITLRIK